MRTFLLIALGVSAAVAAEIRVDGELTGELSDAGGLSVDIRSLDRSWPGERVFVDHKGGFNFTVPAAGSYEIRVNTIQGHTLKSEYVNVGEFRTNVSIRLPGGPGQGARGAVSLRRLNHKIPKQARKEFDQARKAFNRNRRDEAIAHLERAVAIDPEYMEAHNNLGVRYYERGDYDRSLVHFRRAMEIEPGAGEVVSNTAAALAALHRFAEAEQAARRAITLGDTSPKARYLLALSLLGMGKNPAECRALLEETAAEVPHARKVLGLLDGSAAVSAFRSGSARSK